MTPEPEAEFDPLFDELRGFAPAGPPEGVRERVLGEPQPAPEAGALEAELGGFALEQPPTALRERVLVAVEAGGSWRPTALWLVALLALAWGAAAVNGAIAAHTRAGFRAQRTGVYARSAGRSASRSSPTAPSPPRLQSASEGLRRRALRQLGVTSRKG
ncbi:MAG: hypothetical protein KDD82_28480 [Planctomycetes bacterium]|nr:hypothetical protein [Planctomycetota bacterium]